MQVMKVSQTQSAPKQTQAITQFRGVNYSIDSTLIADNQASDMFNMQLDSKGTLQRFLGFQRAIPNTIFSSEWEDSEWEVDGWLDEITNPHPCYGLSYNPKVQKFIVSCGGKLWSFAEGEQPTVLYDGVAESNIESFFMNDKQYFLDGTHYLQYDGASVVDVSSVAYIPTLTLGRAPTGGGSVFEAFNLLQPKFKDSFSGTGSATAYTLSLNGLDATTVTATVNGVTKVETTDFTVNRTTGIVTFTSAPDSGTNNVVITAAKTTVGYADKIKNCRFFVVFGGSNDTRVFVSGNPNFKNFDFRSGLYDPTYFADNGFTKIGSDVTSIKGYAKQYDSCLIFKEDSNEDSTVFIRSYQLNSDGTVLFPIVQGNAGTGVVASKSIQIVEDTPVFLSKKGLYRFSGGTVKDERSMQHLSDNLEPNLLSEINLQNAVSFDYNGKYGLNINGKVYVLDYRNKYADEAITKYEGYVWNNINATNFIEVNGYLYFASKDISMVYRFKKDTDLALYENDGNAFESYWYGKIFSFGADNYKKLVERVDFTLSPTYSRNSAELWIRTNKKEEFLSKEARIVLFDFNNIDFNDFDFLLSSLPQPYGKKVKQKKIIFFQPIFKNSSIAESMTINSITLKYLYQSPIR